MQTLKYIMPTTILFGNNIVVENKEQFKNFGEKAFIVTGTKSIFLNGSFSDVSKVLGELGIEFYLYNKIKENPDLESVYEAAKIARNEKVDFIIAIGGGSPIDAAKAIGVLVKNPETRGKDLYKFDYYKSIPIIAIPTTAGTGSEVTPYAVLTLHDQKTKLSMKPKIFPTLALEDPKYLESLSPEITANTAIDTLSHLIEGYLCTKANFMSDPAAEFGIKLIGLCAKSLKKKEYNSSVREKLLIASMNGGIVIAQTGTTLPHLLSYGLTYIKKIPHGKACGLMLKQFMQIYENKDRVNTILSLLGFADLDEFGEFLYILGDKPVLTEAEITYFSHEAAKNKEKLKNYPFDITEEDIKNMYEQI